MPSYFVEEKDETSRRWKRVFRIKAGSLPKAFNSMLDSMSIPNNITIHFIPKLTCDLTKEEWDTLLFSPRRMASSQWRIRRKTRSRMHIWPIFFGENVVPLWGKLYSSPKPAV